ncbi:MAG TPA: GNAT family N-acetyltransferase [Tepidisphaeraceae bacterium]|jgi:ribosomal protein S18 acetylase RimI-like enzyme|nr:GNAT family N-acetyltransferase [Tepidisphaeraceae bacterium]
MITLRPMTALDAEVFRDVRLRALSDTPLAFGSTHAKESLCTPEEWAARAKKWGEGNDAISFLAFDQDHCCGIIGCFKDEEKSSHACIVSMWVAAEARRQGVGAHLVKSVEEWARRHGFEQLVLDVTDINTAAITFYQRLGFEFTGETKPYPNDPTLRELFMQKKL